jgi:RNA polymerase sigma-70 factor (family 1)
MSLAAQHDQDLLFRIARGDQEAFTRLFEQYHHRLGAFVYGITRSREQAEEIVLDVFLKIWMTREILGEVNNFPSYLFLVARNASISALRKTIRERNFKASIENHLLQDTGPEDQKEFYLSLIDNAIEDLPPQQKKVFLLSRSLGMTYAEIGEELGISPFTVRAHIQQAVAAITRTVRSRASRELVLIGIILQSLKNNFPD